MTGRLRLTLLHSPEILNVKKHVTYSISLFPARESWVSDIPAGEGKIDNLFYSVGPWNFDAIEKNSNMDIFVNFIGRSHKKISSQN